MQDGPTRPKSPATPSASFPSTTPSQEASWSKRRRIIALVAPLVLVLGIVAVWQLADASLLASLKSPERVAQMVGAVRDSPLGTVYVVVGFSVGTLLFVPITGLILGTILAFGPLYGFGYALLGALSASAATYWAGRLSGSLALEYASGPRLTKLCEALRHRAFRASIAARLLPVGNFTVINVLAGSMRIPFRAYFFGNLIGILPGLLFLTFFADKISEAVRNPSKQNLIWVGVVVTLLVALMFALRRYVRRSSTPGSADLAAREGTRP